MNITIEAVKREKGRKSLVKDIRKDGYIPAVVYSEGNEAIMIKVLSSDFLKKWRKTIGELVFFDIMVDGKKHSTVIKDKQIHPVSRDIIHIDFLEMQKDTKITVNIPLRYVGEPVGVEEGGVLEILMRNIEASAFPRDLVEDIEIDISALNIGDAIHIGDINFGNLEVALAPDISIASVHAPKIMSEDTTAELETGQEEAETEA